MSSARDPRANLALRLAGALALVLAVVVAAPVSAQPTESRPLVAFLGPVSGPNAEIGQRAWRSVAMATADYPGVAVERFDTAEDPAAAAAEAIAAGAVALLGPIGELESRAVIATLPTGSPPLFLLAGVDGLEDPSRGVYRLRTSPADQAAALVAFVEDQWASEAPPTFAVLAPEDGYGREAALTFVDEAGGGGGTTLRAAFYEVDEPDVGAAVEVLAGTQSVRLAPPADPWRTPPRTRLSDGGDRERPDFVFVPDFGPQIAAILPHLRFARWLTDSADTSVSLLGLSGWASEALESVGDLAAGARFTQVFDMDDLRGIAEGYALEYRVRFDEDPTDFDAQTRDAAAFVLEAVVAAVGDPSADAVENAAIGRGPFGGVCGDMWISASGGVTRDIGIWEVDGAGRRYPVTVLHPTPPQR